MSFQTANPLALAALVGTAAFLMVYAGAAKRRLAFRHKACPTCRRPRDRCTCRWL